MRYYQIRILDVNGLPVRTWSSLDDQGNNLAGALNIEIDAPVFNFANPNGNSAGGNAAAHVTLYGISLQDIGSAQNFNDLTFELEAGMTQGLPLANPQQKGVIVYGLINQAIGNWQAALLTLDFFITPGAGGTGSINSPRNISWIWKAGSSLKSAIETTLSVAFPVTDGYSYTINVNPNIVLPQEETGYFRTLTEFAIYLKTTSAAIVGNNGLSVTVNQKNIIVVDNTQAYLAKTIDYKDLIGQPSWLNIGTISFKTVMRGDISVNDYVQMPTILSTTTANSYSRYRDTSAMQNIFQITQVRHVGNFRQPDGNSWCSVFNAIAVGTEQAPGA
jgi:hypothetical protein